MQTAGKPVSSLSGAWLTTDEGESPGLDDALLSGHAIVLSSSFATADERAAMMSAAAAAAELDALYCTAPVSGRIRLSVPERLDLGARALSDAWLRRVLQLIGAQLPAVARSLLLPDEPVSSLCELELDALDYADDEPACNIYEVGGEFKPHEDKQSVTVLVPLSENELYEGGGTAFWSEEARGPGRSRASSSAPTLVLQPPAGTALLFGGEVTHAARPVTSGVRMVYVASFTRRALHERGEAQRTEEDLEPIF